jgi:hypothetical protein
MKVIWVYKYKIETFFWYSFGTTKMITYTRESLNKLNDDFKLERYNEHTEKIVNYITIAVVNSSKIYGKKEFINVVRIVEDSIRYDKRGTIQPSNYSRQISQTSIDVYDSKQIDDVINKLKNIFIDLTIEYIESKDLRGNVLDSAIRIKWD